MSSPLAVRADGHSQSAGEGTGGSGLARGQVGAAPPALAIAVIGRCTMSRRGAVGSPRWSSRSAVIFRSSFATVVRESSAVMLPFDECRPMTRPPEG